MHFFRFLFLFLLILTKNTLGCLVVRGKSTTSGTTTAQIISEATSILTSTASNVSETTEKSTTPNSSETTQSTNSRSTNSITEATSTKLDVSTSPYSLGTTQSTDSGSTASLASTEGITTTDISLSSTIDVSTTKRNTESTTQPNRCNSCTPDSLKLVSRNNTPAPIIMGNYHSDGCKVTVVACDIPECADAVLYSYRPNGTFKRVTNADGDVWPHLTMTCNSDGKYMWDGEIQSEFSCFSKDCFIPTTTSSVSVTTESSYSTTRINSTESTVSGTTEFTISTGSTTSNQCSGLCPDIESVMIDDNVVFARPKITKLASGTAWCGKYSVSCEAGEGRVCDSINLYSSGEMHLGNEDHSVAEVIVNCNMGLFFYLDDGLRMVVSDIYCKYKNCREAIETTFESTVETTAKTTAETTTTQAGSCSTCDITSLFEYKDPTDKFKPWYFDIESGNCECKAHDVSCELYGVDTCDSFTLQYISDNGNEHTLAESTTNKVSSQIKCQNNGKFGKFADGENSVIEELYCKYSNCRNSTAT